MFRLTKIDRSTAWRQEERGIFPSRIIVGFNSVRWDLKEIMKWLELNNQGGIRGKRTCKSKSKTYQRKSATNVRGVGTTPTSKTAE